MSFEDMIEDLIRTTEQHRRKMERAKNRIILTFSTIGVVLVTVGYLLSKYNFYGFDHVGDLLLTTGILYSIVGTVLLSARC